MVLRRLMRFASRMDRLPTTKPTHSRDNRWKASRSIRGSRLRPRWVANGGKHCGVGGPPARRRPMRAGFSGCPITSCSTGNRSTADPWPTAWARYASRFNRSTAVCRPLDACCPSPTARRRTSTFIFAVTTRFSATKCRGDCWRRWAASRLRARGADGCGLPSRSWSRRIRSRLASWSIVSGTICWGAALWRRSITSARSVNRRPIRNCWITWLTGSSAMAGRLSN